MTDICTNGEKYVGDIKGGMKPAMKITIMGVVDVRPKSFTVSLLCSPEDAEEDVALLLTVNFQDRSIIRNAKFAGIWVAEEKKIPYFPFTPGNNFKVYDIVLQVPVTAAGLSYHMTSSQNIRKNMNISWDYRNMGWDV
ncbi:galectin-related protein-like [Bufo bufo]|uniref:galectin-related protein-like n=1 Tax=Bufo bufo TaxID=8384 RepID=UPI001ABEE40C|nr:galectin-related protein-like [Bufo bufo]